MGMNIIFASDVARPALLLLVDDDPLITDTPQFVLRQQFAVSVTVADSCDHAMAASLRQRDVMPDLALDRLGLPASFPAKPDEGFA